MTALTVVAPGTALVRLVEGLTTATDIDVVSEKPKRQLRSPTVLTTLCIYHLTINSLASLKVFENLTV